MVLGPKPYRQPIDAKIKFVLGRVGIPRMGRRATNLRCPGTASQEMQNEQHYTHDEQEVD
jgi:hypothetical protein